VTCQIAVPYTDHDGLRLELMTLARVVAVTKDDPTLFVDAHAALTAYCAEKVLAHLEQDEGWLVEMECCPEARLLARAMRAEARPITGAVHELIASRTPCDTVASTRVVHALLAAHTHHEQLLVEAIPQRADDGSAT
jgi:L-alanine-DL-glutamate epimerase-like enolase superfamily enzyme